MKTQSQIKFNAGVSNLFLYGVKISIVFLLMVLLATITWAAFRMMLDLKAIFSGGIHEALKTVMVNSLTILALLEVFMTTLAYFEEGRVKVTYIIDTVIVVIVAELMVFWFKEIEFVRIAMFIVLVLALIAARILAIRFSPAKYEL